MSKVLCEDHPEERLRFLCVPCDILICRDCKLTEHEGHKTIDVNKATSGLKEKLDGHRSRLEQRLVILDNVSKEIEQDKALASRAQRHLEQDIKTRVAMVTSWLKQAEQTALNSLKATSLKVDLSLDLTMSDIHRRGREVRDMVREVTNMAASMGQSANHSSAGSGVSFDHVAALRLEQDMRTGRGKGEILERLTEELPTCSLKPTLHKQADCLTEAMIKTFIGVPLYSQIAKAAPKVALSPLFKCSSVSGVCVNAVCPMSDGTLWVVHDVVEGQSAEQRVALYTRDGKVLREERVQGKVSIARAFEDWVLLAGRNVEKFMNQHKSQESITDKSESSSSRYLQPRKSQTTQVALSKLNARFSVKVNSGQAEAENATICKVETRSLSSLWILSEKVFSISARQPQALDVDSSGKYFAVLLLEPAVGLYRPGKAEPVATYCPFGENFSPADICFHVLNGEEVLLVADWFNSAVHVLAFKETFRFLSYLGAGCPLLFQPTALTSDDNHRLWIGCKGGQILICASAGEDPADKGGDSESYLL